MHITDDDHARIFTAAYFIKSKYGKPPKCAERGDFSINYGTSTEKAYVQPFKRVSQVYRTDKDRSPNVVLHEKEDTQ